jgi:hypothetical protein
MKTKIGDIFSVKLDDNKKKYFQLIAYDYAQLNSDVIRVFKTSYAFNSNPELSEIVKDEVVFYTHCITKLGIKMGKWEKFGNILNVGELTSILFRGSSDSGSKVGEQVKKSNNWYIWKIGDKEFKKVGKLEGENQKAELGLVVNPNDVIERIKTGKFNFFYPQY